MHSESTSADDHCTPARLAYICTVRYREIEVPRNPGRASGGIPQFASVGHAMERARATEHGGPRARGGGNVRRCRLQVAVMLVAGLTGSEVAPSSRALELASVSDGMAVRAVPSEIDRPDKTSLGSMADREWKLPASLTRQWGTQSHTARQRVAGASARACMLSTSPLLTFSQ